MSKLEWGTKRICQSCATKFYDFNRTPIVCPKCSANFDPETLLKSRRTRPPAAPKPSKPVPPTKPAADKKGEATGKPEDETDALAGAANLVDVPDDDDEDESTIEDTSDLGDDEEEISKAVVPKKGEND